MSDKVGPYELLALAGQGGMGSVYRAKDDRDGSLVALKRMDAGAGRIARFERETRLLRELEHPALVRYLDHGEDEQGRPYLAMEWLEGEDLEHRLARAPLSFEESLAIARRIASGLAVAHARSIVHRDVKPSNVFLVDREPTKAKLLDFGVARRTRRSEVMTRTGSVLGTVGYMSPEQAHGDEEIDARADVFSLGCVLFECLTGHPAFSGSTPIAVLAKVLMGETVPLLRTMRPEAPASIEDLCARMLARERTHRPADGNAVREALESLDVPTGIKSSVARPVARAERRIYSTILVSPPDMDRTTITPTEARGEKAAIDAIASAHGAVAQLLAGGAIVVTAFDTGDAGERASRAAACALALARRDPEASIALATGRAETSADATAGPLIDRAATLLAHGVPGRVALDELSARLLEPRYETFSADDRHWLGPLKEVGAEVRRLLGRPTPCVGRNKEIGLLTATWSECIEEPVARVVLVTAGPGSGKTRLAHELVQRIDEDAHVLRGRADPVGAGSTGALARQLVRGAAGLNKGEVSYARLTEHVRALLGDRAPIIAEFLGEFIGVAATDPASAPMCAAKNDPRVLHAWIERSFVEWLEALTKQKPVLVLIDDLQWGDRETIGYLDAALKKLASAPLMVLALARPEVHDAFANVWPAAHPHELRLDALTPGAAAKLARAVLGEGAERETVERVVARADGNAFYLEELLRAVAEGRGDALPESVLAMVQARIDALEPEARRVLLAAAVFGELSWASGVAHVVGDPSIAVEIASWLARLVELELLERRQSARFQGQEELIFRHGLVREAAHATLPLSLRREAHARAAAWRESAGETDARVMVEHYTEADDREKLRAWLCKAAEDAFAAGNLFAADELASRAEAGGAEGPLLARCLFVRASVAGWAGRLLEGKVHSQRALEPIAHDGGPERSAWFTLVGGQLNSAAASADAEGVERCLGMLLGNTRVPPTGPCGFAYYLALSSLGRLGRRSEAWILMERARAVVDAGDPAFAGWRDACEDAWERYFGFSIGRGLRAGDRAEAAFERVGEPMARILSCVVEAMWRALVGQPDRAIEVAERAKTLATAAGTPYMAHFAELWRGLALMEDDPAAAGAILAPLCHAPNAFLTVPAHALTGSLAIARRDYDVAETHVRALEAMGKGCSESAAYALRARLYNADGQPERSVDHAEQGLEIAMSGGALVTSVIDLYRTRLEALLHVPRDPMPAIDETRAWIASTSAEMTPDESRTFAATRARRSMDACMLALSRV